MSTNVSRPEKDTDCTDSQELARAHCHDAQLLGVDGDGDRHYWSIYHQTVVVIGDDQTDTFALPYETADTTLNTLGDWVEYHDGWTDLRYSTGSLVDDLADALEADQ